MSLELRLLLRSLLHHTGGLDTISAKRSRIERTLRCDLTQDIKVEGMVGRDTKRKKPTKAAEADVLTGSRRRCCVCFGLRDDTAEKKGQLAHLDHNRSNSAPDNLVWLCLDHHDQFDSKLSQSKNLTVEEVRRYREKLYGQNKTGGTSTVVAESATKIIVPVRHAVAPDQPLVNDVITTVETMKNMLVARAMNGKCGSDYRPIRLELLTHPLTKEKLPQFVITCQTLDEFWGFIRSEFARYQERREFIRTEFAPLLASLKQSVTTPSDKGRKSTGNL